jgi:hypothetical protein
VIDRTLNKDFKPDDTDREAARSIKEAVKKKKLRRRSVRWYQSVWLKAAGLMCLIGLIFVFIKIFTAPPSADDLYTRSELLVQGQKYQEALLEADYSDGPLPSFLRRFPDDPRTTQAQSWLGEAKKALAAESLTRLQRKFHDARMKFEVLKSPSDVETLGGKALLAEDFGDQYLARKLWDDVRQEAEKANNPFFRNLAEVQGAVLGKAIADLKGKDEAKLRKDIIDEHFRVAAAEYKEKHRQEVGLILKELEELYSGDEEVKKRVEAARKGDFGPKDDKKDTPPP